MNFSKLILSFAIMTFLVAGANVSFAQEEGAVTGEGIGIIIDGEDFSESVVPLIYSGKAYVPVRFLCEQLGVAIYWNESEKTIEIGEKEKQSKVEASDYEDRFYSEYTTDSELLDMNGKESGYGIIFRKDFGDRYSDAAGYINYSAVVSPGGTYQKFGGTISMQNNTNADEVLFKFYENYPKEILIKEIAVKRGENVDFEIDIAGIEKIYIYQKSEDRIEKYSDPLKMAILEPYFK